MTRFCGGCGTFMGPSNSKLYVMVKKCGQNSGITMVTVLFVVFGFMPMGSNRNLITGKIHLSWLYCPCFGSASQIA